MSVCKAQRQELVRGKCALALLRVPVKSFQFCLAVLLVLILGACSSTTFVYNRLNIILPWYLGDYVDLTREQDKTLDGLLQPFLRWHRLEELPRYVVILQNIEQSLNHEVTQEVIEETFSEVERAWLRLEDRSLGWILELGDGLSDEQITEFLAVLQEEQEEYEEKYLPRSEQEYQKESYDNFVDGLEDYLGRLSKDQKASLQQSASQLVRMDGLWLTERASWLAHLSRLLQREPGWQQELRQLKAQREENYSDQYKEMYAQNLVVIQGAIATAINGRSKKQDKRLRKKLRNLREDLSELLAQGQISP